MNKLENLRERFGYLAELLGYRAPPFGEIEDIIEEIEIEDIIEEINKIIDELEEEYDE